MRSVTAARRRSATSWGAAILALAVSLALVVRLDPASADHLPYAPGDVFAGVGNGMINRFSPSGVLIETLDTTSNSEENTGMCFDASGNLYSTNFQSDTMTKFDNQGGVLVHPFGSGLDSAPESCVVDASGNIYVGLSHGTRDLLKFDPSGNLITTFDPETEVEGAVWIDLAADQCTIFYIPDGNAIKRFDVCTDTQLPDFASGLSGRCFALRIRPNGEVMVACEQITYRLDSSGAVIQTYEDATPSPQLMFGLSLDPDGTSFWTADILGGHIYRFDIDSGTQLISFPSMQNTTTAGLIVFGEVEAGGPSPSPSASPSVSPSSSPSASPSSSPSLPGRMTGGGQIAGEKVSHGFELDCDPGVDAQNLQVNWGRGNKFHLENLSAARCSNDPAIDPGSPTADFDTFEGEGLGRCNGTSATIEFELTDAGEPGKDRDFAALRIDGGCALEVTGELSGGNHQAHRP